LVAFISTLIIFDHLVVLFEVNEEQTSCFCGETLPIELQIPILIVALYDHPTIFPTAF